MTSISHTPYSLGFFQFNSHCNDFFLHRSSKDSKIIQLSLFKTKMKSFTSSIVPPFQIAFLEMNNFQFLLNTLQVPIRSILTHVSISWNKLRTTPISPHDHVKGSTIKKESLFFSLGEINMVMNELGFQKSCYSHDHSSRIDILSLFDDDEPSLGEVKVAFDVFDENSDGSIDEFELQNMLCKFGQPKEGAKLEQCRNMIKGFDVNGDGVIDFDEFVKLLETCSF